MDKNVQQVIKKFEDRAEFGLKKYGVTTERTDIDFIGWVNHLQDELMDAIVYAERLKGEFLCAPEATNIKGGILPCVNKCPSADTCKDSDFPEVLYKFVQKELLPREVTVNNITYVQKDSF